MKTRTCFLLITGNIYCKKHVSIDIYGQKSVFCDNDTFNGREELSIIGFFKEFTPELLINELYEFIHKDNSFLCKVIEF